MASEKLSALVVAATLIWSVCGSAQESRESPAPEQDEKAARVLHESERTSKKAGDKTKTVKRFMEKTVEEYTARAESLKKKAAEYTSALASAKDDAQKREVALDYLESRLDLIESMSQDYKFVASKLNETFDALHSIIGKLGEQSALLKKSAEAASDTRAAKQRIKEIQLQVRNVSSRAPEPGTPEHLAWYKESKKLRLEFRKAVGHLKRSIRSSIVYQHLSDSLKMGKMNTARWQAYAGELSTVFEEQQLDLANEKELTNQYIAAVKIGQNLHATIEAGKFVKKLAVLVEGLTGTRMPPIPGLPPPPGDDDGVAGFKTLEDIMKWDPAEEERKFKENIEKQIPQTTGEKASP